VSDIVLTSKQAAAVGDITDWFRNHTRVQQVYRLFGYAGTGKSESVRYVTAELGLDDGDVLYGTFTGKAALVLRKKGLPCRTIHSLIYRVHETNEREIAELKKQIEDLEAETAGGGGLQANAQIQTLRTKLKELRQPRFTLNEESEVRDTSLVVLDEVSMVGPEMAADLISFGKPILVIGDPGQLPPVKSSRRDPHKEAAGAFTQQEPDTMLTEIHRQAAESAVIRLATMARQGLPIPYGRHDEFVWKMPFRDVSAADLLNGGQVICGRNATRFNLNNAMRKAAGFNGSALPTGPGEKIICLKNDNAAGLLNGMFLQLDDISPAGEDRFRASITSEDGDFLGRMMVYTGHFLDHEKLDRQRHDRDWSIKKRLVEATYGWTITAHKSQGSQWPNVIIVDDKWGKTWVDRARWLYTAITRAEEGLVILD
jgi:exodeoxyribonuclease-5